MPLGGSVSAAQIIKNNPTNFDDWQRSSMIQEGVSSRLHYKKDFRDLMQKEKESTGGIPKMQLQSLDPNAEYKRYRVDIMNADTSAKNLN